MGTKKADSTNKKLDYIKKLEIDKNDLKSILRNIFLSRSLDDTEISMRKQNKAFFQISGAGHEGVLTAITKVLDPKKDYFIPYYRDRALCLGLGVTPYEILCQANGNLGDTASRGRQMPSHWGNKSLNIISKSSCTGTQFNQAAGLAEAGRYIQKHKLDLSANKDEIVYVSSGDGTVAQGEFWEGLLTSSVLKLPVLFLVEDNGYAISVPVSDQVPKGSISKTLDDFPGLKIYEFDGNCPLESLYYVKKAEKHLRAGKGPVLLHAHVTRPYSHSLSDDHSMYREEKELEEEKKRDVWFSFPQFLMKEKIFTKKEIDSLLSECKEECKNALSRVLETPWPTKDTYSDYLIDEESNQSNEGSSNSSEKISMAQAINLTLLREMKLDPRIRLFGEDVADYSSQTNKKLKGKGGVFKVTSGLQNECLEGQVFNSPLAEANIVGRAIGMSLRGLRPIVEIQFFDYIWTAFMQLKNELSTMRYRSGGSFECPVVVRVATGGYLRGGAIYHSQSGESFFSHIPGLRVVCPSNASDAAGLLRTAIRSNNPVIFLEHKHLYYQGYNRTIDKGDDYLVPFGKGHILQKGTLLTIVCWGALVQKSIEAVRGMDVEVIDLRTIVPLDMEIIKESLRKTNRLLIVHEEVKTSGFAGEISARIFEECFEYLDAPVLRVTAKDCHVAYCPDLEEEILPQVSDIKSKVEEILSY